MPIEEIDKTGFNTNWWHYLDCSMHANLKEFLPTSVF